MATSVSAILTTLVSAFLIGIPLPKLFYVGAILIIGNVAIFGSLVDYDSTNNGFSFLQPTPSGERPDMAAQNAQDSLSAPLLIV